MALVQLSGLDEAALKGTEAGRFAMALLKAVGEGSPFGWLRYRTVLRDVCRLPSDALSRLMRQAFHYLASVTKPEQEAEVREVITSIPREFGPIKENMMTLLEHLQEEGRQEGLKEGLKEGRQEGLQEGVCKNLIDILSRMFPEFSVSHARRVRNAPDELLDSFRTRSSSAGPGPRSGACCAGGSTTLPKHNFTPTTQWSHRRTEFGTPATGLGNAAKLGGYPLAASC